MARDLDSVRRHARQRCAVRSETETSDLALTHYIPGYAVVWRRSVQPPRALLSAQGWMGHTYGHDLAGGPATLLGVDVTRRCGL